MRGFTGRVKTAKRSKGSLEKGGVDEIITQLPQFLSSQRLVPSMCVCVYVYIFDRMYIF